MGKCKPFLFIHLWIKKKFWVWGSWKIWLKHLQSIYIHVEVSTAVIVFTQKVPIDIFIYFVAFFCLAVVFFAACFCILSSICALHKHTIEIWHSTPILLEEIRIQILLLPLYKYNEIQCAVSPSKIRCTDVSNKVPDECIVHTSMTRAIGFILNQFRDSVERDTKQKIIIILINITFDREHLCQIHICCK